MPRTRSANVLDFVPSAINAAVVGNGGWKPLSGYYASLGAAQVDFPFAEALAQELDWAVLQSALNAIRSSGAPSVLEIPRGTYVITTSVDATDSAGLIVQGSGRTQATLLVALSVAGGGAAGINRPALDCTGAGRIEIADLTLTATATASCGILVARDGLTQVGDEPFLRNLTVNANSSLAAVVNASADLSRIDHCWLYGGTPLVIGAGDVLGVTSAYGMLGVPGIQSTGNSQHTITGGALVAHRNGSGPCIRYDTGAAFAAFGTYFGLAGSGTEYVRLTGSGGKRARLVGCRGEAPGSATNTSVLNAVASSTGGIVEGDYEVRGVGPIIAIGAGQTISGYSLDISLNAPSGRNYFTSGLVRQCRINNQANHTATVDAASWNNTVTHQAALDWFANCRAAGYSNAQLRKTQLWLDNVVLNGSGQVRT